MESERERERSESRSEWKVRGKGREATTEWRVRGKGRAVKPGAPERVEGERDRESSETGAPERKGGKSLD